MPIPYDPPSASGLGAMHTATDGRDVLWNDPDGWEVDNPMLWWNGDAPSNPNAGHTMGNPIPGAEFVVIPNTGHLSNLEDPSAFNRAVDNFLRQSDSE